MKITSFFIATLFTLSAFATGYRYLHEKPQPSPIEEAINKRKPNTIQVALLLDTSNSMDGLIEQAKSRLWDIVNTLTTLRFDDAEPRIEIALYQYGNDGLSTRDDFVQKILPLTNDLDLISEKLFALRTNGGSEYCGAVIDQAHTSLDWNEHANGMKLVYIAGNESFAQGPIDFKKAIKSSRKDDIYVHTILCGNRGAEEQSGWREGAMIGGGEYFVINSDRVIQYVKTPYDDEISRLNTQLNDTYYGYGSLGQQKKQSQSLQDDNAGSINKANYVNRAVSKSKKVYSNASWDLIDRYEEDKESIKELEEKSLPKELRGKSSKEIEQFIIEKKKAREAIQNEIREYSTKRNEYIKKESAKKGLQDDLGSAINISILKIAMIKGYEVKD